MKETIYLNDVIECAYWMSHLKLYFFFLIYTKGHFDVWL